MLQYAGRISGTLLTALTVDRFGRVGIISLTAILMTLSWTGIALTQVIWLHYLLRFLSGSCIGMTNIMTPIYTSENSSPQVRGTFNSSCLMFFFGGQVISCILATYCSYSVASQVLVGLSLISLASTILLREPAQYLLTADQHAKAETQFFWLRGNNETAQKEFLEMKAKASSCQSRFSFAYLLDRRVATVCAINSLVFLTGFPAVSALVSIVLTPADNISANEQTILFELVQFAGAVVSLFVIDRYNRRTLWTISSSLAIGCHLATATFIYLHELQVQMGSYPWLLFGSITAYTTVFSTLLYSLNCTTRGEFLPQKYKAAGSCTSLFINSIIGSIQGFTFLKIASAWGMKTNFLVFGSFSLILLVFCYFCVPETRGMTLVEIEKYFEESKKSISKENKTES